MSDKQPENYDEEMAPEILAEMNTYCSKFLFSLFDLRGSVQDELLDERVRVSGKMESRETAIYHLNDWKNQFNALKPLGYKPGNYAWLGEDFRFAEFSFLIGYEVTYPDGKTETHEGVGKVVMQENVFDLGWMICVLAMPGFKL